MQAEIEGSIVGWWLGAQHKSDVNMTLAPR
jgi:hypothetical protein